MAIRLSISCLLPLILLITSASSAQQRPAIQLNVAAQHDLIGLPDSLEGYRGLVQYIDTALEFYPLLNRVFFDAGSAELHGRYRAFRDAPQRFRFSDTEIPGGTLQKYYHSLNILGYRMSRHPETSVTLQGSRSEVSGESSELAGNRAVTVGTYLTEIWDIGQERIAYAKPTTQGNGREDTGAAAEARSVLIQSEDWELMRPLTIRDFREFLIGDITLMTTPPVPEERIASWSVDLVQNDTAVLRTGLAWSPGRHEKTEELEYFLDRMTRPLLPNTPLTVRSSVILKDNTVLSSDTRSIPVYSVVSNYRVNRICRLVDKTITRFSLLLFDYGRSDLSEYQRRVIREYIVPSIREESKIKVTGHCDVGEGDEDLKISRQRAESVADELNKGIGDLAISSMNSEGVGSRQPLYANDLPEGRFYNRTVQVIIESPLKP